MAGVLAGRRVCPSGRGVDGVVSARPECPGRLLEQPDLAGVVRAARLAGARVARCRAELVRTQTVEVVVSAGSPVPGLRWNGELQSSRHGVHAAPGTTHVSLLSSLPRLQAWQAGEGRAVVVRGPQGDLNLTSQSMWLVTTSTR